MEESWKDIPGFETLYQASTFGRIKSLGNSKKKKEKILKQNKMKKLGYYVVNLSSKKYSVHRLIALTFLNNEDNKPFVNHKNNIQTDNYLSNLEWVTISETIRHGYKMNRLKRNWKNSILKVI